MIKSKRQQVIISKCGGKVLGSIWPKPGFGILEPKPNSNFGIGIGSWNFFFVELWCVVGRRLEYTFSSGKRSRQPQRSMSHLTVMLSGKPLAASTVETAQWLLLGIFVQKVFSKNPNFRYQQNKKSTKKIKPHLLCQFQMLTYQ